jgi:hypothetical protein
MPRHGIPAAPATPPKTPPGYSLWHHRSLAAAQGQIEDAALMSLDEERKGILVPPLAGLYKLCVVLLDLQADDTWVKPIWLHLFHCMH